MQRIGNKNVDGKMLRCHFPADIDVDVDLLVGFDVNLNLDVGDHVQAHVAVKVNISLAFEEEWKTTQLS